MIKCILRNYRNRKITLYDIFKVCLFYMIFFEAYELAGNLKEIFMCGSIVYDLIKSALNIINILVQGLAGSIIFYYVMEYKKFRDNGIEYYNLRNDMFSIIDYNMNFIRKINGFENITTTSTQPISDSKRTKENNLKIVQHNIEKIKQYISENPTELIHMKNHFYESVKYIYDTRYVDTNKISFDWVIEEYNYLKKHKSLDTCFKDSYMEKENIAPFIVDMYIYYLKRCSDLYDKIDDLEVLCKKNIFSFIKKFEQ